MQKEMDESTKDVLLKYNVNTDMDKPKTQMEKFIVNALSEYWTKHIQDCNREFHLFRNNKNSDSWTLYACIKNEADKFIVLTHQDITDWSDFKTFLDIISALNIELHTHAYYFDDVM